MNERSFKVLILAGGSGTRFWPLSRRLRPKQLLHLDGEESLLVRTIRRLNPLVEARDVWVCTTRPLAEQVRQEAAELPPDQVLVEPEGRDTAAAIGWSVSTMAERDDIVAVLPADHRVGDEPAFRATLERAVEIVRDRDCVMTLGVRPRWVEPGFGYLKLGELEDPDSGLRRVAAFREKPDHATAKRYFESGIHLWNAGMFVFRVGRLLDLIAEHEPELAEGLARLRRHPDRTDEYYRELPKISIDFAVMEKCRDLATLPLECEWSDLGSWDALAEVLEADDSGNATRGQVVTLDASDNLLVADRGAIAVIGVSDLVVVRTEDAVLVVPKAQAQKVKQLVGRLGRGELAELL